ncbi:MAG: Na+/H+ antiporter NhaC family protein, partial [Woeseiales bacterium]
KLHGTGLASTPRRAGLVSAISGLLIFVETNVSLLASGVLGRPLFDRLKVSRERLAYIIDSTCAPISVLILFNGWGAYIAGLMASNGVENEFKVLFQTLMLNFYPLITLV